MKDPLSKAADDLNAALDRLEEVCQSKPYTRAVTMPLIDADGFLAWRRHEGKFRLVIAIDPVHDDSGFECWRLVRSASLDQRIAAVQSLPTLAAILDEGYTEVTDGAQKATATVTALIERLVNGES